MFDFTSESDEAIIHHIQSHNHICGRFNASQLYRTLIVKRKQRNRWLSYVASLLLPATIFSQEIKPKTNNTPTTTQIISKNYTSLQIGSLHQQDKNLKNNIT